MFFASNLILCIFLTSLNIVFLLLVVGYGVLVLVVGFGLHAQPLHGRPPQTIFCLFFLVLPSPINRFLCLASHI
jgi:hypothetical protein